MDTEYEQRIQIQENKINREQMDTYSSMKVCFYPYFGGFRGYLKRYVIYMGYVEGGWGI